MNPDYEQFVKKLVEKKPRPRKPHRPQLTKQLRSQLSRFLGRHDWATYILTSHGKHHYEVIRNLRRALRYRDAGLGEVMALHFVERLSEKSIARRVLGHG